MISIKAKEQIYQYIKTRQKARVNDLWRDTGFSRQLIQRKLKELITENVIQKSGKPPLVFYQLISQTQIEGDVSVSQELINFVNDKYLYISPLGEVVYGFGGFTKWADSVNALQVLHELEHKSKHVALGNSKVAFAVFAKSFSKRVKEFEGRKAYCFDLRDLAIALKPPINKVSRLF